MCNNNHHHHHHYHHHHHHYHQHHHHHCRRGHVSPASIPRLFLLLLLPLLHIPSGHASSSSASSSSPFRINFDPFRPSTEYRCGAFTEQQGPQKDPAMRMLHSIQNTFIEALSQPFPHQKLLSNEALLGQTEAWRQSLIENREQWLHFDRWWILVAICLAVVPPLFVLVFLFTRCCLCLCRNGKKKSASSMEGVGGHNNRRRNDRRLDWLRRLLLNGLIGMLVLANVFCASILLLSTQYAQHGLDELPTRLHYCANDLLVYRSETAEQIRKLLRDDFGRFNQSLQMALDGAGQTVVQRLKEETGMDKLEEAITRANNAGQMGKAFKGMHEELGRAIDTRHSLQIRLLRLRQARQELSDCERTATSGDRAAICHQAKQALLPALELANQEEAGEGLGGEEDWQAEERQKELLALLPESIPPALAQIDQLEVGRRFAVPLEALQMLQQGIQMVIDGRREDVNERIHLLDGTLQSNYEQISSTIKSIDLRFMDEQLLDPMMRQREQFRRVVQYGWLGALIISGFFAFIAFAFLIGLCFGCCGRQSSEYNDDDCCVRSTGANFYECSIWLSLALLTVFGILSALAMLLGANTAHLLCHPLREPLARPDMLSLADRVVTLYGLDKSPSAFGSSATKSSFSQIFTAKRRPSDLVQGCAQGKTLYAIFELDKKFALLANGGPTEEYEEMANSIRQFLLSGRLVDEAIGQHQLGPSVVQPTSGGSLPFGARWNAFATEMRQTLEALGRVEMPEWEEGPGKEFCAQRIRFQRLETIMGELRRLKQLAQEKEAQNDGEPVGTAPADGGGEGGKRNQMQFEELDSVLRFMEELRPDGVQLQNMLESACAHLDQLRADVLSLRFNSSTLLANLDRINGEFRSEHQIRQKMHSIAMHLATDLAGLIRQYGEHVNQSMNSEVSSCAPLAEIGRHTRAALCDYALDPLNSLWLTLGLGLALLLPIILLASALNPLYKRTKSYPKYIVPSSSITDSPNEAHFATDIYGLGPANCPYGPSPALKAGNGQQQNYQQQYAAPSFCTQITSPYATTNYGYQELGPPIYMGTTSRR